MRRKELARRLKLTHRDLLDRNHFIQPTAARNPVFGLM